MKKKILLSFIVILLGVIFFQIRPYAMLLGPIEGGGGTPIPKELVVGNTYGVNDTFKANLDDTHAFTQQGDRKIVGSARRKTVDGLGLSGDAYETYSTHMYIVYMLDTVVNAPYQSEVIGYLSEGDACEITFSTIQENTFEISLASTIKRCLSNTVNALFHFDLLDIGLSSTDAIESSIELDVKSTTAITNMVSQTITYSITESGVYHAQRRANYYLYMIASFEIVYVYRTETRKVGLYENTYYIYSVSGYKLLETKLWYKLNSDIGIAFSRHEYDDNGQAVYAGPILNDTYIYL